MTQNAPHENSPDFAVYEGMRTFGERLTADNDLQLKAVRHTDDGYALVLETVDGNWHQVVVPTGKMKWVGGAAAEHDDLVKWVTDQAYRDDTVIDRDADTSAPLPMSDVPTVVVNPAASDPPTADDVPKTGRVKNPPKMAGNP